MSEALSSPCRLAATAGQQAISQTVVRQGQTERRQKTQAFLASETAPREARGPRVEVPQRGVPVPAALRQMLEAAGEARCLRSMGATVDQPARRSPASP